MDNNRIMDADTLRKVMDETGSSIVDVASATKVSINTIYRYLKNSKTRHPSIKALLEQWVVKNSKKSDSPEAA